MTLPGQWNHDFAEEPMCRLQEAREKAFQDFLDYGEIPGMDVARLAEEVSGEFLELVSGVGGLLDLHNATRKCLKHHITQTITEGYLND